MANMVRALVDGLVFFATDMLIPFMAVLFLFALVMRTLVFYTVKRQKWFSEEFQKRVNVLVESDEFIKQSNKSFYVLAKKSLEKTFYEIFEVRSFMKRRKPDFIMAWSDRVFLIQQGSAWYVKDILRQLKFLPYQRDVNPKIFEISKSTFQRNPAFNKVFGIIPASVSNELLNMVPGIFIVLGVFGTFLGIMAALPELSNIDLTDPEGSKNIMDTFLLDISFSMSSSIMGILLSVTTGLINAFFNPTKSFIDAVDRMEISLFTLWNVSDNNDQSNRLTDFDEHKDPVEALAEQSIDRYTKEAA